MPRLGADVSGGHGHGLDPELVTRLGDIDRVFEEDRRVVVRERHAADPNSCAVWAIVSGDAWSASVSIAFDFEISQFWQNRHARLHPAAPNENTDEPGRKWLSGFFSIGSTQNPLECP